MKTEVEMFASTTLTALWKLIKDWTDKKQEKARLDITTVSTWTNVNSNREAGYLKVETTHYYALVFYSETLKNSVS